MSDVNGAWGDFVSSVTGTIRGHKHHWQESITNMERDQLLEDVANHVTLTMESNRSKLEDAYLGSVTEWGKK